MNRAQRKIGWWFVIILAVIMMLVGIGACSSYNGGAGVALIIAAIAIVGVWAFIAAGSKKDE